MAEITNSLKYCLCLDFTMSDIRFVMIGVGVLSAGFIVMAVFGTQYQDITIQTKEFSECYDYTDENVEVKIDCDEQLQNRNMVFAGIIGILVVGGLALLKGIRGTWDNDVKPEEMLGPGGDKKNSDDDKKSDS
tara:strand:- start:31 stop:429 length:399 start_codon:yes stop_codon:yes gene_type:complete